MEAAGAGEQPSSAGWALAELAASTGLSTQQAEPLPVLVNVVVVPAQAG